MVIRSVLIFLISICSLKSLAQHTMSCSENGNLQKFTSQKSGCSAYKKLGTKACGDSAIKVDNPSQIALATPVNTLHSTRNSGQYNRKMVQKIIKTALDNGQDPYLYLGIMMVESPVTNRRGIQYINDYGVPPMDSIAVADVMKCANTKNGGGLKAWSNSKADLMVLGAKDKNGESLVLDLDSIGPSFVPAQLGVAGKEFKNATACMDKDRKCCANVYLPKGFDTSKHLGRSKRIINPSSPLNEAVQAAFGAKFIENKFKWASRKKFVKNARSKAERISKILQTYNGVGTFGSGDERVNNKCLNGIDMKSKPIYGAGVSDLMLNGLMGNSEIRNMVKSQSKGRPIKSFFCSQYGKGKHKIQPLTFANLQKKYVKGRRCSNHSYKHGVPAIATGRGYKVIAGGGETANGGLVEVAGSGNSSTNGSLEELRPTIPAYTPPTPTNSGAITD